MPAGGEIDGGFFTVKLWHRLKSIGLIEIRDRLVKFFGNNEQLAALQIGFAHLSDWPGSWH